MKPTPATLNGSSRSVNARLADVEPTVEALLTRCDELLIAGKALAARVTLLEKVTQATTFLVDEERDALDHHVHRSFWQRLSWLVRGV